MRSTINELEKLFVAASEDHGTLNQLAEELQYRKVPRAQALLAKVHAALDRPLMRKSIGELESMYVASLTEKRVLTQLRDELANRSVPRAQALLRQVAAALASEHNSPAPAIPSAPTKFEIQAKSTHTLLPHQAPIPAFLSEHMRATHQTSTTAQPSNCGSAGDPPNGGHQEKIVEPLANKTPTHSLPTEESAATQPKTDKADTLMVMEAYQVLRATPGSTWEQIELARRQIVNLSHPTRLAGLSAEMRARALAHAQTANAAAATILRNRGK